MSSEITIEFQCQAEQFFEYVTEPVFHLWRYIFEDRRYGLFKFDGQLCEVHLNYCFLLIRLVAVLCSACGNL